MPSQIANLRIRLKGFEDSDTSSQFEGYLEPGKYIVEEYKENFPDQDTDYVCVKAPSLGAGDTWICSRWKSQRYADIVDAPVTPVEVLNFEEEDLSISEEDLVDLLPEFEDFTYDIDEARYPYQLRGVNLPQAPPRTNNCCTFVEALLVQAWSNAYPEFQWRIEQHRQMMIISNDDLFSPVTAVVEAEMGIAAPDPDTPPHPWTVIQGWRANWRSGHTFIIVDHHQETDRVLTLESNSHYTLNGVGFRMIGNLRDVGGAPPVSWWEQENLWTWERVKSAYHHRQQAWLKVRDRTWSGLAR